MRVLCLAAALLLAPAVLSAQGTTLPDSSRIVRVHAYGTDLYVGHVDAWRGDTLVMQPQTWSGPLHIPGRLINRLEVRVGTEARSQTAARQALVGGAIGLVVGAVVGSLSGEHLDNASDLQSANVIRMTLGFGGGLALLGALDGAFSPRTIWATVAAGLYRH